MADKKEPGGGSGQSNQPNGANQRANDAARNAGLNKDQKRELHDQISGQNLTYKQIEEIAKEIKKN